MRQLLAFYIIGFSISLLTGVSCSKPASVIPSEKQIDQSPAPVVKMAWEVDWEKTEAIARKEGQVVIITASKGPALKEALPVVKKKFGLDLDIISRRGGELAASVFSRRRAGIYGVDVIITGMNTIFGDLEPAGIPEPLEPVLILPEILDANNWYGGVIHWGTKERTVIHMDAYPNNNLAVNTELVKADEIKSYYDILNPKWKGKIVMNDPSIPGSGIKSFSVLAFAILDLDFFRQLAKLEPVIIRDQNLQVNWLAQGKYAIAFAPIPPVVNEFKAAGAKIDYVLPKEGTYFSRDGGGVVLVNRAPHPNAAKIFINWLMSREGLTIMSRAYGAHSARVDVPTEGIPAVSLRQPGVKYFMDADTKEWINRDHEFRASALEIFGHLMK